MKRRLLWWTPYLAFVAFNFYASSLTWKEVRARMPFVKTIPQQTDFKLRHVIQYGPQAVAALLALERTAVLGPWEYYVGAVALVTADGGFEEAHQFFVPTRICSLWDVLWDTLGGLTGLLLYGLARRLFRRPRSSAGSPAGAPASA
jgi:VanZ family protein